MTLDLRSVCGKKIGPTMTSKTNPRIMAKPTLELRFVKSVRESPLPTEPSTDLNDAKFDVTFLVWDLDEEV